MQQALIDNGKQDEFKVVYAHPWSRPGVVVNRLGGPSNRVTYDILPDEAPQLTRYNFETGMWVDDTGAKFKNGKLVE
jgi:hypothetical protein